MNVLKEGIPNVLPDHPGYDQSVPHAPKRNIEQTLRQDEKQLAVRNALRYFPIVFMRF